MLNRILLVSLASVFAGCPLWAAALLEWDRTEAAVDMEPGQEEARASFVMTNKSDEPVRIERIKTSCGCTGSVVERKLIPPGESTEIVATFHRGKRRGGVNTNRLEVFLEGLPRPVAQLRFVARIPVLIDLQPQVIFWNAGSTRTPRAVRMKLDPRYVGKVETIAYDEAILEVRREPDAEDPSLSILHITPKDFDQPQRGEVMVTASGEDGVRETARIHVLVQP